MTNGQVGRYYGRCTFVGPFWAVGVDASLKWDLPVELRFNIGPDMSPRKGLDDLGLDARWGQERHGWTIRSTDTKSWEQMRSRLVKIYNSPDQPDLMETRGAEELR